MKILDCTKFANDWNANKHPMDGSWSEEINWKEYTNSGYTHVIVDDKIYTMSKYGCDTLVFTILGYTP